MPTVEGLCRLSYAAILTLSVLFGFVQDGSAQSAIISGSVNQPLPRNKHGDYVAVVTVSNGGYVPIAAIEVTADATALDSGLLISEPPEITNLDPGMSATFRLLFSVNSVPANATAAMLNVSGTYSLSNSTNPSLPPTIDGAWELSFAATLENGVAKVPEQCRLFPST
jgi:hypothetical protein